MYGIKKLPSGRWQARYFAGFDNTGKRIYPSKSFLLQADAIKWRRDRIHEKDEGSPIEALELTVGAYLDRWLETKRLRVRGNTINNYARVCRLYIRPAFESKRLRTVTPLTVQAWQQELLKKVSGRTVSDTRQIFSMALRDAVNSRLINFNPVLPREGPKWEAPEMKTLTLEQSQTFAAACGTDRWATFYVTMLMSGLRPEEAQGLCWSAVELTTNRIRVQKALLVERLNKWKFQPPKTTKSKREIAVQAWVIAKLSEHRTRQLKERLAAGSAYENHDLVFSNPIGQPLLINALEVNFKKRLDSIGLPRIRLYDLRHTFCTLSLAAGIDLKTVSADMGHASVAFTLDHYGHVLESMREGAAQRREEFFGNPSAARGGK